MRWYCQVEKAAQERSDRLLTWFFGWKIECSVFSRSKTFWFFFCGWLWYFLQAPQNWCPIYGSKKAELFSAWGSAPCDCCHAGRKPINLAQIRLLWDSKHFSLHQYFRHPCFKPLVSLLIGLKRFYVFGSIILSCIVFVLALRRVTFELLHTCPITGSLFKLDSFSLGMVQILFGPFKIKRD